MKKELPLVGLGTWQLGHDEVEGSVVAAMQAGYEHIDTAQIYNNEYQIGQTLKKHNIDRKKIFITTKVWIINYKYHVADSIKESLKRLQTNYIDLVLLHAPLDNELHLTAYQELMKLRDQGLINHIGVSNWTADMIQHIKDHTGEYPYANQIIVSPKIRLENVEKYCKTNNIKLIGWSTIRPYYDPRHGSLSDEEKQKIDQIAEKYQVSPALVMLRWSMQIGYHVIPKSKTPSRVKENLGVTKFTLSDEEVELISSFIEANEKYFFDMMKQRRSESAPMTEEIFKKGLLFEKNFSS